MDLDEKMDALMKAGLSAFYIVAGIVVVGRALNSQSAMSLVRIPVIGPAAQMGVDALRAVWNQVYDVGSQD